MSGGKSISTSETRIEALKLQSSAYGVTLPLVWGVTRIPGNLLWYGGFRAIPHTTTESQGGKGGSPKVQNTSYTYESAIMMGLCEGEIAGVARLWRGKTLYEGGNTPAQILTASEVFTVPGGGGSVTVANAANYATHISVRDPGGGGETAFAFLYASNVQFTRVNGVYTFPASVGGRTVTIKYQYLAPAAAQTSLQQVGLSLAAGGVGQAVWSHLTTNFPSQAVGYSGIAHVRSAAYDLGTSAAVDNHNFEVQAPLAYSISVTVPDADPAQIAHELLTNARAGANFPATRIAPLDNWSNYCRAAGLLLSPALTEQAAAAEVVKTLCSLTNTAPVWSDGALKFVPFGDQALTGNGATYTPNVTPIYDLTDDHFLDTSSPVKVNIKPQADVYNQVQIEFLNRSGQYNVDIAEAKDQADIDTYGLRTADVVRAHWVCDPVVARAVGQLLLQRKVYIRNTYEFRLPWNFALLEPMDLVTLTDGPLQLARKPVRITRVTEAEDGELAIEAEDFPLGTASAAVYPSQSGAGFAHNFNASPGSVAAPTIFEAPGELTLNGLEVYVAATGLGADWGGCNVWVSLDGSNYKAIGSIAGGSRYGTLSGAVASSGAVPVAILKGTLTSGSAIDASTLNTLCFMKGATEEFFSYQTATLTSALHYTLAGTMARGVYGTTAGAHSSGDAFVRVDDAVARSGPIDLSYVGKTIHIKLTSYNVYGFAEELLSAVTDYTYTITGARIGGNAGAQALPLAGAAQGTANAALANAVSARGLTLAPSGSVAIVGNDVTKTGTTSAYDASVTSVDGYTGGAMASARAGQTTAAVAFGINTDPVAATTLANIDYSWLLDSDGTARRYFGGTLLAAAGSYTTADVFAVAYDGAPTVRWLKNGAEVGSLALSAPITAPLYLDSALFTPGSVLAGLKFQPLSAVRNIGTDQLGANAATDFGSASPADGSITSIAYSGPATTLYTDIATLSYTNTSAAAVTVEVFASAIWGCSGGTGWISGLRFLGINDVTVVDATGASAQATAADQAYAFTKTFTVAAGKTLSMRLAAGFKTAGTGNASHVLTYVDAHLKFNAMKR